MMKARLPWIVVVVLVLLAGSFAAGSSWRGRKIRANEEARGKFFEAAQGQFHWPEGSKEWTEMLVPLGGYDFTEYGERWLFTAMYEGTQTDVQVRVVMKDSKDQKRQGASVTLSRAVPEEIPVDLAAMRKEGLDLKTVTEMVLEIRGNGKAGRLLVAGLVNPRPALVRDISGAGR